MSLSGDIYNIDQKLSGNGADDLQNAINTIHLAKEQWNKIVKYSKNKYIIPFIIDINNWNNNINTIKSNFLTTPQLELPRETLNVRNKLFTFK